MHSLTLTACVLIGGFACSDSLAECASSAVESIFSSSNLVSKEGVWCGSGCDKKYYLCTAPTSYTKIERKFNRKYPCNPGMWTIDDIKVQETTVVGSGTYTKIKNPASCTYSATTETSTGHTIEKNSWKLEQKYCTGLNGNDGCEAEYEDGALVDPSGTGCTFDANTFNTDGWTTVAGYPKQVNIPCQGSVTINQVTKKDTYATWTQTTTTITSPSYSNEFTTDRLAQKAKNCAMSSLGSLPSCDSIVPAGNPSCSFYLFQDSKEASCRVSKWRAKVSNLEKGQKYKATITWDLTINGNIVAIPPEIRSISGRDEPVWCYPSDSGEILIPDIGQTCNYSYVKTMRNFVVEPDDGSTK